MTIGERIRYYRKSCGITQGKLAELSGIHPVSIRKYETDKMVPLPAQIERISEVLGVSVFAIAGMNHYNFQLVSTGDFMGLLLFCVRNNVIIVSGKRDKSGKFVKETVFFTVNPLISNEFSADAGNQSKSVSGIKYVLKNDKLFNCFLEWERLYNLQKKYSTEISAVTTDENREAIQNCLNAADEGLEQIELELQRPTVKLDMSDGITVATPPFLNK